MSKPYRVVYWAGLKRDFPSFADALSFYDTARTPKQLVSLDDCDGSDDAPNPSGLTAAEKEAVEMVDWS
jgi:hypothetical protein